MSADRVRAYIALGANLGDSAATLKTVLDELRQTPGIAAVTASRFYRTAPVEATGPDFVNAAAALDTTLAPLELLDVLQALELRHGRERLQERAAHAGPGHAAPRRPVPRRPAPGPAPSPHAPARLRAASAAGLGPTLRVAGRPAADWLADIHDQPISPL